MRNKKVIPKKYSNSGSISTGKSSFDRPLKVAESFNVYQSAYKKWEETVDRWYDIANKLGLFDDRDVLADIVVDSIDEILNLKQNDETIVKPTNVISNAGFHFFIQESVTTPSVPDEPEVPDTPDEPDTPTIERICLIHNTTLLHNMFVEITNGECEEETVEQYTKIHNVTLIHNVYTELKVEPDEYVVEKISYLQKKTKVHNVYTNLKNK